MTIGQDYLTIFVASREKCYQLQFSGDFPVTNECTDLTFDHEEADTGLILYAFLSSNDSSIAKVIIASPDTDVAIIASSYAERFSQIQFATGRQDKQRILSIADKRSHLGDDLYMALPAIHAFSGADSTSALDGIGKQDIYNLVKENLELVSEFKSLGTDYCIPQLPNLIENLVCKLYGSRLNYSASNFH